MGSLQKSLMHVPKLACWNEVYSTVCSGDSIAMIFSFQYKSPLHAHSLERRYDFPFGDYCNKCTTVVTEKVKFGLAARKPKFESMSCSQFEVGCLGLYYSSEKTAILLTWRQILTPQVNFDAVRQFFSFSASNFDVRHRILMLFILKQRRLKKKVGRGLKYLK